MVGILLDFIRSTRTADWTLHLLTIRKMIPWLFAYDRVNYSRYLTLYWCEMTALPETHRDAHDEFLKDEFCVQCSASAFRQIPVDQPIEQTVNRDSKTKGGIICFSQKPGAVQKWIINAHQRAEISRNCLDMAGLGENTERLHKDCGKNRVKKDEASVQAVLETMRTGTNPFAAEDHVNLCNISSGVVVTDDIAADLLHAYAIGERHFIQFVNERLKSSNVNFYDPLPKLKLKTFRHC